MCDFYSLRFNKGRYIPLIKRGVRVEIKNEIAYLNGIFSYKLLTNPLVCGSNTTNIDELFANYPNKLPWIVQENDGNYYLYKGAIDPYYLTLKFDDSTEKCYMQIEFSASGSISIDAGRVMSRLFSDEKQTCMLEIKKYANIIIEQENLVTILEWDGETFICK